MKKILLFLLLVLIMSCSTYRVINVLDYDDGTSEYTLKGYDEYKIIFADSSLFNVNDKVKLKEIEKLK